MVRATRRKSDAQPLSWPRIPSQSSLQAAAASPSLLLMLVTSLPRCSLLQAGNMTSPLVDSRRSSPPVEAERSTPSAATGAQPLPSTRRELRWAFPVDDSTARRIGHRSRSSGGITSTAVRSSGLRRRASSPSPQPYPRQRDGGDPRRRSRSTSGGAGFDRSSSSGMFTRRQSSSPGPAARPSSGGGVASSWGRQRRRQRQWGRPRKLCAAAVSRHVAQHTAGNLLAVRSFVSEVLVGACAWVGASCFGARGFVGKRGERTYPPGYVLGGGPLVSQLSV